MAIPSPLAAVVAAAFALTSFLADGSARAQGTPDETARLIELCVGCHGADGRPTEPDIPIIAGQEFYYLYVQLKDYSAGRRANERMGAIAADLSRDQMKAAAEYFSTQTWPHLGYGADEKDVVAAKSAAVAGMCTQCHLGGYLGNSRVPRLAGQQVAYLERTMLEFKTKIRLNAAAMNSLFAAYDDSDIAALARYLAGL